MALAVAADPTPVRIDADGVARVGGTRVRLASIVYRHQAEVDAYLDEQDHRAEQIREEIEARPETRELRERLRALKQQSR